jgi:hypothetical protein
MLRALSNAYRTLEAGRVGPSDRGDARDAVLGEQGDPTIYADADSQAAFRWYRYLFLGRGKPSTHVRVLSSVAPENLRANIPEELRALLTKVAEAIDVAEAEAES